MIYKCWYEEYLIFKENYTIFGKKLLEKDTLKVQKFGGRSLYIRLFKKFKKNTLEKNRL